MKIIAVDLGASNGRCMLVHYDSGRFTLETVNRFMNEPKAVDGQYIWDTRRLFESIADGLARCSGTEISSMGIDTWGVDFALLDKAGQPVLPAYCYRSPHTDGMMEKAFAAMPKREIYARTGIQFLRINTLYQLMAIAGHSPGELEKTDTLLMMPDYFAYLFSGEKTCEYSMASTSQMLDAVKRQWDDSLIEKAGLDPRIFLPVKMPGTVLGTLSCSVKERVGFDTRVITVAGHDTASAVAAIPCEGEDFAYISCGTWSLLGAESQNPVINDITYQYNFTNEGGASGKIRLLKNIMGLWILQQLKGEYDTAGQEADYPTLISEAERETPFSAFVEPDDVRFLEPGPMTPRIREYLARTGQRTPSTRGGMVRCILESLAMKYRYEYERLRLATGRSLATLHMIGGGIQNKLLCQFTADSTGARVLAGPAEATAMGNAIVQLAALGEIASMEEGRAIVRNSISCAEYLPKDRRAWDDAYGAFLRATGLGE